MAVQILINIILAVFWLFLSGSYTMNSFVLGFLFALLLVYLMRQILPGRFYVVTIYKVIKLAFIFIIELIKANFDVLKSLSSLVLKTNLHSLYMKQI